MSEHTNEFQNRPHLVRLRARAIFWQRALVAVLVVGLVSVLGLLVYDSVNGAQTRTILLDCVEIGGKCHTDSQKRTGIVVQQLIDENELGEVATRQVVVLALACAVSFNNQDPTERARQIQACVESLLKEKK